MVVKLSDLQTREVVNILDGKKLGHIVDLELDVEKGKVLAIILPGKIRGWSFFCKREEVVVPWNKIVRIGRDVILVEVPTYSEIDAKCTNYFDEDDPRFK